MEIKYARPTELEPHPLNLELVPEMAPEEFEALFQDVKEKGVLQPLEVQKGTNLILDGRNRWKAALRANLEMVPYREVDVPEDEVALYILERVPTHRSLPPGVRAALAAEWVETMKPLAEAAQDASRLVGKGVQKKELYGGAKNCTTIKTGRLREEASKKFGVNHQYIQIALNLKKYAPESFELLKRGELSIQEAVAFSGSLLLKRTHHVGEEADHHSQTHDPRGTEGLPEKTWAFTKGSRGAFGCFSIYYSPLGNRSKSNSFLSSFHFELFRERNLTVAPPKFLKPLPFSS